MEEDGGIEEGTGEAEEKEGAGRLWRQGEMKEEEEEEEKKMQ